MGLLSTLLDLSNGRLLLDDEFLDISEELSQISHILLDLSDSSGTCEGGLAGIVGLARTGSGCLIQQSDMNKLCKESYPLARTYHECLLLPLHHSLDTSLQLVRGGLRVGYLVPAANLLLQALVEVGLVALVGRNLILQALLGDCVVLSWAWGAAARGVGDTLQLVAQVAESSVDLILNVVDILARHLVLLAGVGLEESSLGGTELSGTLPLDILNSLLELVDPGQESVLIGDLLHVVHFWE